MISSRYNFNDAIVMACRVVLLVLTGVGLSGCMLIPTPSVTGYSVITDKSIESLEPGKTTRADVLLKLGEPGQRLKDDRIFVYHWVHLAGFGIAPAAEWGSIKDDHYLGLEFGPDNRLKRVKEFSGGWLHPTASPSSSLGQWISGKPESPHQ